MSDNKDMMDPVAVLKTALLGLEMMYTLGTQVRAQIQMVADALEAQRPPLPEEWAKPAIVTGEIPEVEGADRDGEGGHVVDS
jgi:hypothetical protein